MRDLNVGRGILRWLRGLNCETWLDVWDGSDRDDDGDDFAYDFCLRYPEESALGCKMDVVDDLHYY